MGYNCVEEVCPQPYARLYQPTSILGSRRTNICDHNSRKKHHTVLPTTTLPLSRALQTAFDPKTFSTLLNCIKWLLQTKYSELQIGTTAMFAPWRGMSIALDDILCERAIASLADKITDHHPKTAKHRRQTTIFRVPSYQTLLPTNKRRLHLDSAGFLPRSTSRSRI